jgi:hypothetical protein
MDEQSPPTIRDLYPHMSDQELAAAEASLTEYLLVILRIHERLRLDPDAYARFLALTGRAGTLNYNPSRSDPLPAKSPNNP